MNNTTHNEIKEKMKTHTNCKAKLGDRKKTHKLYHNKERF